MQFTKQTITVVKGRHHSQQVEAMISEDAGLGYYLSEGGYDIITASGYGVTELHKFNTVGDTLLSHNERIAQRFIENIAHLIDWKLPYEQVITQVVEKYGDRSGIGRDLEEAYRQVARR